MAGPLPFNALYAFVVAARFGSFSKAAEELHVTPAAVSQQIRMLEDLLGIPLFHRLHRGLRLTEAGEQCLPKMSEGFDSINEAVRQLKAGSEKTVLNIWTSPSFASKWLMPRVHKFIELNPHIDFRISGSASLVDSDSTAPSLSAETLKAHNIDVAIRFGSGRYPGCIVDKLMEVDAITLCSPSLLERVGVKNLSKPKDLMHQTLLHDESPYEGRPKWEGWFVNAGLGEVVCKHNLYFNSVLLALSAAIAGQGVVLTLKQLAEGDMKAGHLVQLFDLPMAVEHSYHLVSLEGANADPCVHAFKTWLFEEISGYKDLDS